jgi:hypothetical protein
MERATIIDPAELTRLPNHLPPYESTYTGYYGKDAEEDQLRQVHLADLLELKVKAHRDYPAFQQIVGEIEVSDIYSGDNHDQPEADTTENLCLKIILTIAEALLEPDRENLTLLVTGSKDLRQIANTLPRLMMALDDLSSLESQGVTLSDSKQMGTLSLTTGVYLTALQICVLALRRESSYNEDIFKAQRS